MIGSKGEDKCQNFCCSSGLKSVYLGLIVFTIGLMMANQASVPQVVMIVGSFITILGLISMFARKGN